MDVERLHTIVERLRAIVGRLRSFVGRLPVIISGLFIYDSESGKDVSHASYASRSFGHVGRVGRVGFCLPNIYARVDDRLLEKTSRSFSL